MVSNARASSPVATEVSDSPGECPVRVRNPEVAIRPAAAAAIVISRDMVRFRAAGRLLLILKTPQRPIDRQPGWRNVWRAASPLRSPHRPGPGSTMIRPWPPEAGKRSVRSVQYDQNLTDCQHAVTFMA